MILPDFPAFRIDNVSSRTILVAALVLVAIAYSPALQNGFVSDDSGLILRRQAILESADGLGQLVSNVYWWGTGSIEARHDLYRPFVSATWWLDYQLSGTSPLGYHLSSYVIHIANTALTYWAFVPLAGGALALSVAVLFGLGPVAVTSVGWASGRTDVWALFFVLGFLGLFFRGRITGAKGYKIGAAISFFLALASKEAAVIAPILAWAFERAAGGRMRLPKSDRPLRAYGELLIPFILYLSLRWWAVGVLQLRMASGHGSFLSFLPYLPEQILLSMIHAIIPLHYSFFSELTFSAVGDRGVVHIALWLILAGLAAWIVMGIWRRKLWAVGGLWFGLTLLPVYATGQYWAPQSDFYTYAGLPGLWLFVIDGLRALLSHFRPKSLADTKRISIVITGVALAFAVLTFIRLPILRTEDALSTHMAAREPNSARALMSMGEACFERGDDKAGEEWMRRAATAEPKNIEPWKKCAQYFVAANKLDHAAIYVDTLAAVAPNNGDVLAIIGQYFYTAGRCNEAVETYRKSLACALPTTYTLYDYGMALLCAGDNATAAQVYELALQQRPSWPEALLNLGLAYENLGRLRDAVQTYRTAIAQDPKLPAAWESLAIASISLNDRTTAQFAADNYFALNPPADRAARLRNMLK